MTFREKYRVSDSWQAKILVMSLYHTIQLARRKRWTERDTAEYFGVSIGLVSENLKIANHMDREDSIRNAQSRQDALRKITEYVTISKV